MVIQLLLGMFALVFAPPIIVGRIAYGSWGPSSHGRDTTCNCGCREDRS